MVHLTPCITVAAGSIAILISRAAASFLPAVDAPSILARSSDVVDWSSQPLERSPADPDIDDLAKRYVYAPPITHPTAKTVWKAGCPGEVQWDIGKPQVPEAAKNYTGEIRLGYLPKNGAGGENLKWQLAQGFPITKGQQTVTLPSDLDTRHDYIVVLLGDSGNRSKKFTILGKGHTHACSQPQERAIGGQGIMGRDVQA